MAAPPPVKDGPRVNEEIRAFRVLLIDEAGEKQGEMPLSAALEAAVEAGLDLVEVAAQANPPVVKIMDYGKFRFQEQKKKAEARKNAKAVEIKEIKVRPGIDDHDYGVKVRAMHRFFEEGDKVKVTLRFKGREIAYQHLGIELLNRIRGEFEPIAKVEQEPRFEGKQVIMVMAPRAS
ncbi:MAG: translation initiation factor IF-3 [Alphaproteobacteria bacterium]|nr:translation initiation factor IF-3 [Alphaproteobacteria bacterium]